MSRIIRDSLRAFLHKYPRLASQLRKLHAVRYWCWRRLSRMRARRRRWNHIDPQKTLWVAPSAIAWALTGVPAKESKAEHHGSGRVAGGDWDKNREPWADEDMCSAVAEHFNKGTPWQKTPYFQRLLHEIHAGRHGLEASNQSELMDRMSHLDTLYQRMKNYGSKSAEGARPRDVREPPAGETVEIRVRIGRDGGFLLESGRHALAIARLLEIPLVPVKVSARHLHWAETLTQVWSYAHTHDGAIYSVIRHPDLQDVPAMHGYGRLELIRPALPSPPGTVLDIGCHWGFFCIELERMGFSCIGVEADARHLHFLRRMRAASGSSFHIVPTSIFEYDTSQEFALVIALYIFHHFFKSKDLHDRFVAMLGHLNTNAMILGCHNTDQSEMQTAYMNPAPEDFVAFILEHSCLTKSRHIGSEDGQRELYLLER